MLLFPLSCISYLGPLIRLTPTTNQGGLIWYWRSSGLLSVVGYGYVQQFLCECLLIISVECFVVGLIGITMINQLV